MKHVIYNAQGEQREVDAVDARELIETGRWSYVPPETVQAVEEAKPSDEGFDETSEAAYEQRKAEFEAAQSEKAAETEALEKEIKKSKAGKK